MLSQTSKQKTAESAEVRERRLQKHMDRYWPDKHFRNANHEKHKKRAREIVCCAECKTYMCYGSMFAHRKICKGFRELTPLDLLTNCLYKLRI
jgi:hypothetical protein